MRKGFWRSFFFFRLWAINFILIVFKCAFSKFAKITNSLSKLFFCVAIKIRDFYSNVKHFNVPNKNRSHLVNRFVPLCNITVFCIHFIFIFLYIFFNLLLYFHLFIYLFHLFIISLGSLSSLQSSDALGKMIDMNDNSETAMRLASLMFSTFMFSTVPLFL